VSPARAKSSSTARYPHQRALAQSLGVTRAFATIEEMIDAIGPESMDVVIETVGGKSDALTEAVSVVARGGTIAMLGVFDGSPENSWIAVCRSRTDAGRIVLLRARLEDRRFRVCDRAVVEASIAVARTRHAQVQTRRSVARVRGGRRQEIRLDQGSDRTLSKRAFQLSVT
jgi:D-arabinose 1-dehydrogenase-like Zn-dependent alcohol dehydrogenase